MKTPGKPGALDCEGALLTSPIPSRTAMRVAL